MNNQFLSPHFALSEFTASATASKNGIANEPSVHEVANLRILCENTLEPLREAMGLPIIITSGYRCKELNELITHHSSTSQHMAGQAADFHVAKGDRELLIQAFRTLIEQQNFDQLIIYPTFIHVSYISPTANRHKLTQGFTNGKYKALTREAALSLT